MKHKLISIYAITMLFLLSSCIGDPGLARNAARVTNFSLNGTSTGGCGNKFLMWSQLTMCSPNGCPTKTHIATAAELTIAKQYINDVINKITSTPPNSEAPVGGTVDLALLNAVNNSAGICLADLPTPRPTGEVYINTDFCSCLNGKSDIINDCATACSARPVSNKPTLYLSTTVGPNIQLNSTLGNLQGWCNNPLTTDKVNPQCTLTAWDGTNTVSLAIASIQGNTLTADITLLALNKTYIVSIAETSTGSNAKSQDFQIRRVAPAVPITAQIGAFKVAPISQYTCLSYQTHIPGAGAPLAGQIVRDGFVRQTYYFAANETPPPLPPLAIGVIPTLVCHDDVLHPGSDSILYPRLELIPQEFSMWDKSDPRFAIDAAGKITINKIIDQRLVNEYGYPAGFQNSIQLFAPLKWANRPGAAGSTSQSIPMGVYMAAFSDPLSGKHMCPSRNDFLTSTDPQFRILKDYIDSSEAIYIAEGTPDIFSSNGATTTIYGQMFITEGNIKKYGFYVENGLKILANQAALETKTIYYYWPVSSTMDPLQQGGRKLFTIKTPSTLANAPVTGNLPTTGDTSDKRLGCVPTSPVLL